MKEVTSNNFEMNISMKGYCYAPLVDEEPYPITAAKKNLIDLYEYSNCQKGFQTKQVKHWGSVDVVTWFCNVIEVEERQEIVESKPHNFNVDGPTLLNMTEDDFVQRDPRYGRVVFSYLQRRLQKESEDSELYALLHEIRSLNEDTSSTEEPFIYPTAAGKHLIIQGSDSEDSSDNSDGRQSEGREGLQRKKPGGHGRLWLFVRDLLKSRRHPDVIDWTDRDNGTFKVKDSKKFAELWGRAKNNPGMTYEKMARALRYNYRSGYLRCVKGRKLMFAFGPNATEWQEEPSLSQKDTRT